MNKNNTPINSEEKTEALTLLDIVSIFLEKKKYIFLGTLIVCIIAIILYFFVFNLIYKSTASIKSTTKSSGLLGALDGSIPDIGGLDDIGIGGNKSAKELASYEEILKSRSCIEDVITKFDLMKRDQNDFMEDAIKEFREEKLEITQEKLAGILYINIYDKDPVLAKDILNYLLERLDKLNIEMSVTNAKNNREFIEKRYLQAREDLRNSEDTLKSFQLIYGISPDLQIKASAQSIFTLEAELKSEEVKLDVIKKMLGNDQPEVKLQEAKVNSLRNKITEINTSTDLSDFLRLGNSPNIAMSFLRLQREVEIQTKILTFMLPLYEQAKIEEKRDTPTIIILDKPVVAEKKSKPKRLTMVLGITFASFIFLTFFFVVKFKWSIFKSKIENYKK